MLDAPLTAGALTPPAAAASVGFTDALLFHFSDANPLATAADYSAVIAWGDGTFSTVTSTSSAGGQIVADGSGGFDVLGTHLYTQQLSGGTFSVQVADEGGSTTGASQTGFNVAAPPLLATGGLNLSFAQGQAIGSQTVVATFTDPGGDEPVGDYSASINWGDGTAASAGAISLAGGVFTVAGGHTYATMASPYTVVVTIDRNGVSEGTATDTASITGPHTMAWVAAGNGNWTDGDWENLPPSYPDATIDVEVSASVVVTATSNQAANSLTLSNGATVVIAPGASLTVTNGVTLSSGAAVDVESGGTLFLAGLVQGSGAAGVTLAGGTLEATGAFSTTVPITIAAGGGTVDANGFDVTLAGGVSGRRTDEDRRRHADPLRRQRLHGRHVGQRRHAGDHHSRRLGQQRVGDDRQRRAAGFRGTAAASDRSLQPRHRSLPAMRQRPAMRRRPATHRRPAARRRPARQRCPVQRQV